MLPRYFSLAVLAASFTEAYRFVGGWDDNCDEPTIPGQVTTWIGGGYYFKADFYEKILWRNMPNYYETEFNTIPEPATPENGRPMIHSAAHKGAAIYMVKEVINSMSMEQKRALIDFDQATDREYDIYIHLLNLCRNDEYMGEECREMLDTMWDPSEVQPGDWKQGGAYKQADRLARKILKRHKSVLSHRLKDIAGKNVDGEVSYWKAPLPSDETYDDVDVTNEEGSTCEFGGCNCDKYGAADVMYFQAKKRYNWEEARKFCQDLGMKLPEPKTRSEHKLLALNTQAQSNNTHLSYTWLGGRKSNKKEIYVWDSDDQPMESTYIIKDQDYRRKFIDKETYWQNTDMRNYFNQRKAKSCHRYTGNVNKTKSGQTCLNWNEANEWYRRPKNLFFSHLTFEEEGNACRNPNNDPNGSWCYTKYREVCPNVEWETYYDYFYNHGKDPVCQFNQEFQRNGEWEYCDVEECDPSLPEWQIPQWWSTSMPVESYCPIIYAGWWRYFCESSLNTVCELRLCDKEYNLDVPDPEGGLKANSHIVYKTLDWIDAVNQNEKLGLKRNIVKADPQLQLRKLENEEPWVRYVRNLPENTRNTVFTASYYKDMAKSRSSYQKTKFQYERDEPINTVSPYLLFNTVDTSNQSQNCTEKARHDYFLSNQDFYRFENNDDGPENQNHFRI